MTALLCYGLAIVLVVGATVALFTGHLSVWQWAALHLCGILWKGAGMWYEASR